MQCSKKVIEVVSYLTSQEPSSLLNILTRLPKMGVGRQVTRNTWNIQDKNNLMRPAYWTITKVIPNKDMKTGNVWGTFAPRGSLCLKVRSVRSIYKNQWLLLPKDFDNRKLKLEPSVSANSDVSAAKSDVSETELSVSATESSQQESQ